MNNKALEILKKHVDTTQDVVIENDSIIAAMREFGQIVCSERMEEIYSENTGVNLISKERFEQIDKHNRTIKDDALYNGMMQLSDAAAVLTVNVIGEWERNLIPIGWNPEIWNKMLNKRYKDRLKIAGAFIAAEIDRLNYVESQNNHDDLES